MLDQKSQPDVGGFSDWEEVYSPKRLIKDYQFESRGSALEFLRQLFLFEDEFNHHAKVTIEHSDIRVEVWTHDIEDITELDFDYAQTADLIYFDVKGCA